MGAHIVARVGDIPANSGIVVELEGRAIGVFNVEGDYYALRSSCPHQRGPLCEGRLFPTLRARVEESGKVKEYYDYATTVVACPWHGWEFDVRTGSCLADPARRVKSYRTEVDGDRIVVHV